MTKRAFFSFLTFGKRKGIVRAVLFLSERQLSMQTYDPWKPVSRTNRPLAPQISKTDLLWKLRQRAYYAQQPQYPDTDEDYYESEERPTNWIQRTINAIKYFWWGFDDATQHALQVIGIILLFGVLGSAFVYWVIVTGPPTP